MNESKQTPRYWMQNVYGYYAVNMLSNVTCNLERFCVLR